MKTSLTLIDLPDVEPVFREHLKTMRHADEVAFLSCPLDNIPSVKEVTSDITLLVFPATCYRELASYLSHSSNVMALMITDEQNVVFAEDLAEKGYVSVASRETLQRTLPYVIRNFLYFGQKRKKEQRHNQDLMENVTIQTELSDHLLRISEDLERMQEVSVLTLAKLTEYRDFETGEHIERMRTYTEVLAKELGKHDRYKNVFTHGYIKRLGFASLLHDIGKVGIPDGILLKPDKLTEREFEIMKMHTTIGGDFLSYALNILPGNEFFLMAYDVALHHHERHDGKGYPKGVAGDEIPLSARILSVADVYDALTSKRPYKKAFSHETAKEIIETYRGDKFDPVVVDAFFAVEREFYDIRFSHQEETEEARIFQMNRPPAL